VAPKRRKRMWATVGSRAQLFVPNGISQDDSGNSQRDLSRCRCLGYIRADVPVLSFTSPKRNRRSHWIGRAVIKSSQSLWQAPACNLTRGSLVRSPRRLFEWSVATRFYVSDKLVGLANAKSARGRRALLLERMFTNCIMAARLIIFYLRIARVCGAPKLSY
jgi:hypothetical protein